MIGIIPKRPSHPGLPHRQRLQRNESISIRHHNPWQTPGVEDIALLNDYAAALSSRASQLRRDDDAALAATVANRAWSLQHSPETAWNRAVSIESLRGTAGAESAWRDYLALDSTSDWAREARTHLARP